jgi:4'-phosphopantetheinyl transferase
MIIVKYCNIDIIDNNDIPYYLDKLPVFMQNEILRYKYVRDQKSRLLSRLMLQESLEDTGSHNALVNWKRNANHKPAIDNWNAFNISHDSDLAVFAYTTGSTVGIDIEKKENISYWEIIDHFHPEEQQFIKTAIDPENSFYRIWVKKEALLKALGTGIVNGLNDFSCVRNVEEYQGNHWHLKELKIHSDYVCYLCHTDYDEKITIQEFKFKCPDI